MGHSYGEWYVEKEASCTTSGIERRVCETCSGHEDKDIPAKQHIDDNDDLLCDVCNSKYCKTHKEEQLAGKNATCTQSGLTSGKKCSQCGTILKRQKEIPANGHNFGAWTQVQLPTTTTPGLEERTCDVCGEKEQQQTDVLTHEPTTDALPEASETTPTDSAEPILPNNKGSNETDSSVIALIVVAVVAISGGVFAILIKRKP